MDGSVVEIGGRRLVFMEEVLLRLGVSYPTMMGYVKEGLIESPRIVGTRIAWTDEEVEGLIDALPRGWPRGRGRPRKGEAIVGRDGRVRAGGG